MFSSRLMSLPTIIYRQVTSPTHPKRLFINPPSHYPGSGITLFVIQSSNPLNTTLTLDGNMSTTATLVALPGPNDFAYNVTLYNVQDLHTASHTLDVALLGYVPSSGPDVGSMVRFDYALINNTAAAVVEPSASGAGSATATPSSGGGSSQ